jgi:plasmid stability protein
MASITIRGIDAQLKARLRARSARHGRSLEAEARAILCNAVALDAARSGSLADAIAELFRPLGGVELEIPVREPMRKPPRFG